MMNMYREVPKEETPKKSLKEVFKEKKERLKDKVEFLKLTIETSTPRRNKMIKTIAREIKALNANDAETMQKIHKLVVCYELCSPMYGRTLDEADMNVYLQKIQENGTLKEIEEDIKREMRCYDVARKFESGEYDSELGNGF